MVPLHMKEELRCVTMDSGVQCVMMLGAETMLQWLADSLDFLHGVRESSN